MTNNAKKSKVNKLLKAQVVPGFADQTAGNLEQREQMLQLLKAEYELHGFEWLETPFLEYSESLGKFLPDQDRPNAGVFSLQADDEQWLSLRYDLTAPLARFFAENFETLAKPYKSYRYGWVFRNEKPGPGRFRQFMQFDADIVGSDSVIADAEMCILAADSLEKLGVAPDEYVIRVNNRKILDGILRVSGLDNEDFVQTKLTVLRAIDKLDKFGIEGVKLLLGAGRLDESGDFTKGAGLDNDIIEYLLSYLQLNTDDNSAIFAGLRALVKDDSVGLEGVSELEEFAAFIDGVGYNKKIKIDPSLVRGLEYYTGCVFEATLLLEVPNEAGQTVIFGSVGGGGRYDGLVSRFSKQPAPATGFSIGVSRLMTALYNLGKLKKAPARGPVIVAVMDKDLESLISYHKIVKQLQAANINSELYVGNSGLKAQLKYADRRKAPCVIIQGSREREEGVVQVKDLELGLKLSKEIQDNAMWRQANEAQASVRLEDLVEHIKAILSRS